MRAGLGGGNFIWIWGDRECAGWRKKAPECCWNVSCGFPYSSKTSHLPPDLAEKVRIKELQHFSSTMNFKNGIAVQSNDWYFSKQTEYNCIMVSSALAFLCIQNSISRDVQRPRCSLLSTPSFFKSRVKEHHGSDRNGRPCFPPSRYQSILFLVSYALPW